MNENKKLNDEALEGVTGGELIDAAKKVGPSKVRGGCGDCALSSNPNCPYVTNREIMLKKLTGQEDCSGFVPKG